LKEYASVFGFILGVWLTRRSLTLTWDLEDFNDGAFPSLPSSVPRQQVAGSFSEHQKTIVEQSSPMSKASLPRMKTIKTKSEEKKANTPPAPALKEESLKKVDSPLSIPVEHALDSIQTTAYENFKLPHKNVTYDTPFEVIRKQVDEGNLTAGQFALDFAIVGFPKCGTSTMSK
jgi:hypothetical protein